MRTASRILAVAALAAYLVGCADKQEDAGGMPPPQVVASTSPSPVTATPTAAATATTGPTDGDKRSLGAKRPKGLTPGPAASGRDQSKPSESPATTPPEEPALDSNGRFATTYRPGRGHLSAFESAVERGLVPAADRELVADVGSRHTPDLPLKVGKALTVRTDLEREKLPPTGGPFHLRIALQSTPERGAQRPRLAVQLVVDTSGSMKGEPIARAREAARALVDKLEPTDAFALVTFSTDARVDVRSGPVGSRRGDIRRAIDAMREGGNTNIGRGLELAYAEAMAAVTADADVVPLVLLVSDGKPTVGPKDPEELAKMASGAFQSAIQTSALGLGTGYDAAVLGAIAGDGAGAYYHLSQPSQIASALATEIDRRVDPVATAVEVRVWLEPYVELLGAYGSRKLDAAESRRVRATEVAADHQAADRDGITRDRQDDIEGGMRFFIPAFARDDAHAILLKLRAPPAGPTSPLRVGVVEIKYKDRVFANNVFEDATIWAPYASTVAESSAGLNASMARTIAGFAAGQTLLDASTMLARGERDAAASLLFEREDELRLAASALDEPMLSRDADRFSRLRLQVARGGPASTRDPLLLGMVMRAGAFARLR